MVLKQIIKQFNVAKQRQWDEIYFFYDIHETILVPDYDNLQPLRFYPFAKEALQLMTKHPMIVNILYTCSHPDEIARYQKFFKEHDIEFAHVNENPLVSNTHLGCFDKKPYMSVLFEDKAGFDALTEWEEIYLYFYTTMVYNQMDKTSPEYAAMKMQLHSTYGHFKGKPFDFHESASHSNKSEKTLLEIFDGELDNAPTIPDNTNIEEDK